MQRVVPVGSGDGPGQMFDAVPAGQVGQVELRDGAAAAVRRSDGPLLRKVVGRWRGRQGSGNRRIKAPKGLYLLTIVHLLQ